MNCELKRVTYRAKNGEIKKMDTVFIRGSNIRYFLLPELLKHASIFEKIQSIAEQKQKSKGGRRRK